MCSICAVAGGIVGNFVGTQHFPSVLRAVAPDRWLAKPNCGPIGRQYTPTGPGAPPVRGSSLHRARRGLPGGRRYRNSFRGASRQRPGPRQDRAIVLNHPSGDLPSGGSLYLRQGSSQQGRGDVGRQHAHARRGAGRREVSVDWPRVSCYDSIRSCYAHRTTGVPLGVWGPCA